MDMLDSEMVINEEENGWDLHLIAVREGCWSCILTKLLINTSGIGGVQVMV